jgi:hypothetical protein
MKRLLATISVAAVAVTASGQDLLGPLPIRDQFLLSNGFFFFVPESPRTLPSGYWSLGFSSADSNTFAKSGWVSHSLEGRTTRSEALNVLSDSRFAGERTLFLVDGETHRTDFTLSRGFSSGLEVRVGLPLISTGGGWSDHVIERVHHMMKIGNAQRESLRRNTETVYLRHDGATYIRSRGQGVSIGDMSLSAKYELDKNLAVVGSLELPTGDAQRLDGSGSIDSGVELIATRTRHSTRFTMSLGIIRLGANGPLGTRSQTIVTDTFAIAHAIGNVSSIIAQLTVSESPFRQIDAAEFTRRTYQFSTGFQRQMGPVILHAAFIENVVYFENSADAGIAWGVSRRF